MHRVSMVLIAALRLACACAHRRTAVSDTGTPQPADSVTLIVTNHALGMGMVVYADAPGGLHYRLGTVELGTHQFVLRFNWLWGRSVEFVSESGWYRSGHLDLRPGDVISWDVTMESSRASRLP